MAIELSDSQANIQPPEEFLPILRELMPHDEANEEGSAEEPQDN
jgi:hypothetical protein